MPPSLLLLQTVTLEKVYSFYKSDYFKEAPPVRDALKGLKQLKALGCSLIVVTARGDDMKAITAGAVEKHFPGMCWSALQPKVQAYPFQID